VSAPLLETRALDGHYGDFQALFSVDVTVAAGETVALIGANGAGKSTLLRTIAGLNPVRRGAILLEGEAIGGLAPERIVAKGVALTPEGRRIFASLTVEENIAIGAWTCRREARAAVERAFALFPALAALRRRGGTELSGGQQQMLAIARALASSPRLLLCDEISLGLAPVVIDKLYEALAALKRDGRAMLLVEQDAGRALAFADRAYCMREGRVTLEGSASQLTHDEIHDAYFGT
jgi:branched-chain amino acid transport system ATP-binding protein